MVIDTRSGERTWLHEEPAQVGDFAFSPDGEQLAYLHFAGDDFTLRVHHLGEGETRTVALRTERPIASSSPIVWTPDGSHVLLTLRAEGWAERAREAFHSLTAAPVIVQDSRNDFLAWDRVRNMANEQATVLVDLADGSVRELLDDVAPQDIGFTPDGARMTYATAERTKTSYTRRDGTDYGLYVLELGGGDPIELIAALRGAADGPVERGPQRVRLYRRRSGLRPRGRRRRRGEARDRGTPHSARRYHRDELLGRALERRRRGPAPVVVEGVAPPRRGRGRPPDRARPGGGRGCAAASVRAGVERRRAVPLLRLLPPRTAGSGG